MTTFGLSAGIGLSSAVTHFSLGLRRPRSVEHLLFAGLMSVLVPFQWVVSRVYKATAPLSIVSLQRWGVVLGVALITLFAAFVLRYTGAKVSPWIRWAYLGASLAWILYDLVAPYGLLLSTMPAATPPQLRTELPPILPFPTSWVGICWQTFNALTIAWSVIAGASLILRGGRRRGLAVVVGSSLLLASVLFDLIRDLMEQTTWPYLGGFGIVGVALVFSGRLAGEFRENERRMARMVATAIRLRDQLNTPLQTIRFGLELMPRDGDKERARLERMQRAVTRLATVGHDLDRTPLG
jgi:hypothetical protein